MTSHKLVGSVEKIFENLPKPLKWRSFYRSDLDLLVDSCIEVQEEVMASQKVSIHYVTAFGQTFDIQHACLHA